MDITEVNGYKLTNLSKINILLGKNGCGKSMTLRSVEQGLLGVSQVYGKTKYITPERGGFLAYEAGVEQSLINDTNWMPNQRRRNLSSNFREQSFAQYKKLETLVLREIEYDRRTDTGYTFDVYLGKINSLLDNIEIQRRETVFKIFKKGTATELAAGKISSGESELISLGIECLVFSKECIIGKENILFLDEPDVHLHPDLQVRLMFFLKNLASECNFKVILATHSTAILGALESYRETGLAFLGFGQKDISFLPISDIYRKVLPVFGAHPLSNVFNQAPILLIEGEDDERIWQQVVRSSNGLIKLYPCAVTDGISSLNEFELAAQKIIKTIYDNARGYSLRDRDGGEEAITDLLPIIRMKLNCRNAENLLLTDESLVSMGKDWQQLKNDISVWLSKNENHVHFKIMSGFKDNGFDRMGYDIKEIRYDLMGIIGCSKPWEVVVGRAIAKLRFYNDVNFNEEGKLFTYLGEKIVGNIIPKAV